MVEKYFNKKSLQNINPDEVIVYYAALVPYLDLKIQDIISKPIGIRINQGKKCNIILLPLKGAKMLNFSRDLFFLKMLILIFKILEFMKEKMKNLWKIIVNNLLISIFIKKRNIMIFNLLFLRLKDIKKLEIVK